MSFNLRLGLIVGSILFLLGLTLFSRKMKLKNDYAVIWIILSCIILFFAIFPNLLIKIVSILGVESPVNGVYLIFIFILLVLVFYLFIKISILENKCNNLIQKFSIENKQKNKE